MLPYDLSHLTDAALDRELAGSVVRDRASTADLLARLAEFDSRKRYLAAGYPHMHAYCTEALHFSDDEAFKRIHVARTARRFPLLFEGLADGKLHLSAVRLLSAHLTPENVEELVDAAAHRSCSEIESMLGRRLVRLETLGAVSTSSTNTVETSPEASVVETTELALIDPPQAARPVSQKSGIPTQELSAQRPAPEPAVWVALDKRVHDKLEYARTLLSHRLPLGSESQVIERALDDLITKEERSKFAATERPRPARGQSSRLRHIPAHVKRAVWKRDGGRCTLVGEDGHRCGSRDFLEFDHVDPVARGGKATVDNVRLRCRAHNQYEAERAFGAEFMQTKRERAEDVTQARQAKPG